MAPIGVGFVTGALAGLAAAPHCLGMCGGFPLHLSGGAKGYQVIARPLLFVLGKTFTYAFLGALGGFAGNVIVHSGIFSQSQRFLSYGAGAVMVVFGLAMLGVRLPRMPRGIGVQDSGLMSKVYGAFFVAPGRASSLCVGLAAGFLPCPITLALLVPAVASHQVFTGMAFMTGLGLGTAPPLLAAGIFGSALDRRLRVVGLRAAGIVVVAVGIILMVRGTGLLCQSAGCHHNAASPVQRAAAHG